MPSATFPSNHKCFQAFSQHGAIHRGAFRHGAHGEPRLRRQEDRGGAWCAAIDNEAVVAEATLGRRHGVAQHQATASCGGWCVCLVCRVICPTSLELSCVPLVCWSMAVNTAQSSFNRLALHTSLPWTSFCGTSSKYSLFSIQLLTIPQNCGHFRPACITERREMFEKISNVWVRSVRGRQRRFLREAQTWQTASYRSKTQRKNTSSTRHLTPWHSPQTPTAPQKQTTRGKTLLFFDASRTKNFDPPEPQNGPNSLINLENGPLGSFLDDRAADGRQTQPKKEGSSKFRENAHFYDAHFSPDEK